MNINQFNNLNELNNFLSQFNFNFKKTLNSSSINSLNKLDKIVSCISDNAALYSGPNPNSGESLRFIKNVSDIKTLDANSNNKKNSSQLKKMMQIAAREFAFSNTFVSSLSESVKNIEELKFINKELYYQTLAFLISKGRNFNDLKIEEEELLECAPWLTCINIDDASSNCAFTEKFIGKLLSSTKILEILDIQNSKITGKCLKELKNAEKLKEIKISSCENFDEKLPNNLPNLCNLTIENCDAFNQEIPKELPNLENLRIVECKQFNNNDCQFPVLSKLKSLELDCPSLKQTFPELPALEKASVTDTKPLPKILPTLKNLKIRKNDNFNQNLPNTPNLTILSISGCPAFNRPLPNTKNLQSLMIDDCHSFDQNLPENLPNLTNLIINKCPSFNSNLPVCPKLKLLYMNNVPSFKPFEQHLPTLLLFNKFSNSVLQKAWEKLSIEEKKRAQSALQSQEDAISQFDNLKNFRSLLKLMEITEEEFLIKFPEFQIRFDLLSLENLLINGNTEEFQKKFIELKSKENYIEYLQMCIESFPVISSYLIRKQRDAIVAALAEKEISIDDLSHESQLALLPLLTPEKIQKVIEETSDQEKKQWLAAHLQFEQQFSGRTDEILKEFQEKNLDGLASYDHMLDKVEELLNKIPLKTLAAFAEEEENSDTVLAYKFAMDDAQLSVVIPFLKFAKLLEYLKKQDIALHKEVLRGATEEQKDAYLKEALNFFSTLQNWKDMKKSQIVQIALFDQNPTKEKLKELETFFVKISQPLKAQLLQFNFLLKALDQVLSQHSPSHGFLQEAVKFLVVNAKKAEKIQQEVDTMRSEITKLSEKIKSSEEEIPDEFIDQITGEVMQDPWTDENGNTLDKTTWDQCKGINPFTREPLKLKQNLTLKGEIEDFFKEHPELQTS